MVFEKIFDWGIKSYLFFIIVSLQKIAKFECISSFIYCSSLNSTVYLYSPPFNTIYSVFFFLLPVSHLQMCFARSQVEERPVGHVKLQLHTYTSDTNWEEMQHPLYLKCQQQLWNTSFPLTAMQCPVPFTVNRVKRSLKSLDFSLFHPSLCLLYRSLSPAK